jgi:hypothetical protein
MKDTLLSILFTAALATSHAAEFQSTFVLPVQGRKDGFIFMADRWKPENAIDGRYIWLPIQFDKTGKPFIELMDRWDLLFFDGQ